MVQRFEMPRLTIILLTFLLSAASVLSKADNTFFSPPGRGDTETELFRNRKFPFDYFGNIHMSNGPYFFMGCTAAQGLTLTQLFQQLGRTLETKIIPDAKKGPKSQYGFASFFSTSQPEYVASVYSDMDRAALTSSVNGRNISVPDFVCANSGSDRTATALKACGSRYTTLTSTDLSVIFLCPRFWNIEPDTPSLDDCPSLNGAHTAFVRYKAAKKTGIYLNKFWAILHPLVNFYTPNPVPPDVQTSKQALRGINSIIKSTAEVQIDNPSAYSFYASFVQAGCTNLPNKNGGLRLRNRRQTIPASDNSTIATPEDLNKFVSQSDLGSPLSDALKSVHKFLSLPANRANSTLTTK